MSNKKDSYQSLTSEDGYKPTKANEDRLNKSNTISNNKPHKKWYQNYKTLIKIIIFISIISFLILAIIYRKTTAQIFREFLKWMQNHVAIGSVAFIGVYWVCTVLMIPGSILTLGVGFVFRQTLNNEWFGILFATFIVFIGASLGAINAFVLGRFVLREKVASYKQRYERFDIIDQVVEKNGFKVTLLLRLSPIVPFNAFNYFMGLTSVTLKAYSIACIGMIPGTLAYCFVGGTLNALTDSSSVGFNHPTVLIFTIVATVIALIGMTYMAYVAKKEFNKMAAEIEATNLRQNV